MGMPCEKCGGEIPRGEEMEHRGQVLCEDCYVDIVSIPKTCNVGAVYSAKQARKSAGHKGAEGLTPLQKEIYDHVREMGKVTADALAEKFNIPLSEVQRQFATLRHCELLKGSKIDGKVFIVVM